MILTTMQPAYFPALDFFWKAAQCDILILTDHFQYTKRSSLTISAPLQQSQPSLTIPVRHGNPTAAIYEKQVDPDSNWSKKHLHTIRHIFHHTPFAYYYLPLLEELLKNHPHLLSDFLTTLLINIFEWLHLDVKILPSSQLDYDGDNHTLVASWCKKFNCNTYIADKIVFSQHFVDKKNLTAQNIKVLQFASFPDYHIMKDNRELSILHFLFQFGPEAGYLLRQYLPST